MFGLIPCVLSFCTTVVDAVVVFAEVACLHNFVEEELTFFIVRLADQIFIRHGKYRLEYVHYCSCKLLHAKARKRMYNLLI